MFLKKALSLYLKHLIYERNLSANTIESYKRDIKQFLRFLLKKNISDADNISIIIIRDFFKFIDNFHYSIKTILRKFSSINNFLRFLEVNDHINFQITHLIKSPKPKKRLYNYLSKKEARSLLDLIEPNDFYSLRDKTIIEIFYSTGARISEVTSIKLSSIDIVSREIRITGKGRKERVAFLSDSATYWLKKYITERKEFIRKKDKAEDCSFLFLNKYAKGISSRSIRSIIKKSLRSAGIKRNIKPHDIRHSFATHLIQNGAGIREIQELLGHENLSTTQIYTHLDLKKLKNDYKRSHPRAKD